MAITASVTPGRVYQSGDAITVSNLNQLGNPTVDIQGTVSGASLDANSVENSHVKALAAIDFSKLATLNNAQMLLGSNAIPGVPTARTVSGDVTIDYLGEVTIADDAVEADMILAGAVTGPKIVMTEEDDARGDILIRGAANYERLAKPETAAGEVLTFAALADDPAWVAPVSSVLNFEQIMLTGTEVVQNHSNNVPGPVVGTAGNGDAFWAVIDDNAQEMISTSAFTITSGNKVRISVRMHTDTNSGNTAVAGILQRSVNAGVDWTSLGLGDASSTRVQVTFVSIHGHGHRGMGPVHLDYIDTPGDTDPLYRVIWTVHPNNYMYLNRDYNLDSEGDSGGASTAEYRCSSTMIVEEIEV
jgi:hypothetical protein